MQQRLRLGAWLRGAAIFTGTALVATVVLVLILNRLCVSQRMELTGARLALLAALAAVAAFRLALPAGAADARRARCVRPRRHIRSSSSG